MKRPFGTIGLTFLTVLAVAFHYQSTVLWIILSSAGGAALAAGAVLAVKKVRIAPNFIVSGGAALLAVLSLFLYQNIYFQPIADKYSDKELNITAYVCDEIAGNNRYTIVPVKTLTIDGEEKHIKMNLWYNSDFPIHEYDSFSAMIKTSSADTSFNKSKGIFFNVFQVDSLNMSRDKHYDFMSPAIYARMAMKKSLSQCMSKDGAAICRAVLFGDKDMLGKNTLEAFDATGTTFLIVVSGLHLSVAVAAFSVILKLFRRKKLTAVASIVAITAFTMLSGFTPSVSRAAIGAGLFFLGHVLNRDSDGLTSLGIAALVLGLINPFSVGNVGMLMSFAAVFGIHLWSKPIRNCLESFFRTEKIRVISYKAYNMGPKRLFLYRKRISATRGIVGFFISLTATSLSASLFILPISFLSLGKLSPLVVVIALVSEPLASAILVLALITSVINLVPFLALLAMPFSAAADLLSKALAGYTSLFTKLPFSCVKTDGTFWYIWIAVTALSVIIGYCVRFRRRGLFIATAVNISLLTLLSGIAVQTLTQNNATELILIHSNGGTTAAVNGNGRLSVISLAGNKTKVSAVMEELKSLNYKIDDVIILNSKYNLNYLYALYNEFDVSGSYFDPEITHDFTPPKNAGFKVFEEDSVTEIELNSDAKDTVFKLAGAEFQYLTFGEKSVLFVPKKADLAALDAQHLSPDFAVVEGVPKNIELLCCGELIYTGAQSKKFKENKAELLKSCRELKILKTETLILK